MKKNQFMKLTAVLCFIIFLTACSSGGSGGGSDESSIPTTAVSGTLTMPDSSPVDVKEIDVEVFNDAFGADAEGGFTIDVPEERIVDATVMLPQREGDSMPAVYLFTTLLPGETDIEISKEETAVGLLMNGISHDHLSRAGTPQEVKQVLRQNGQAFIKRFKQMIEADPYVLRVENLDNVYDQTYIDAVLTCKSALENLMPAEGNGIVEQLSVSPQWRSLANAGRNSSAPSILGVSDALIVKPDKNIDDFVIHADTGNLDHVNIGGKMTGSIQIENDSMLFGHYRVTDATSGKVLKEVPEGFLETAFNPDILGPQGGWSTGFWASTGLYKAKFQSVIVEIYTPGLKDATWAEYSDGPSVVLGCRTIYSNMFIPAISMVLPADGTRIQKLFKYMWDRGILEIPFDKWAYRDWGGGAWDFVKKIAEKDVLVKIVETYLEDVVTDHEVIIKHASKMMVKIAAGAKHFEAAGLAVDLGKLAGDVASTQMLIEFHVIFPVALNNLTPTTMTKVADEEDNPVFKIDGIGFDSFTFGGQDYELKIYLESKDADGDDIVKNIDPDDITINDDGTELAFQVPFEWAEVGSKVAAPIYVNVIHHFIDYSGIDEVVRVELPEKAAEEHFKIDIVTDLAITSLSEDKVSENDDLIIYGEGFAEFSMDNRVYFIDAKGNVVEVEVDTGDESYLKVMVPEGLSPGQMKVYVELKDKSRSNEKALSMQPKMVTADPESGTHFDDDLDVWLFQEQNYDIYYSIDSGSVKKYTGPITLSKGAHIYPFARATIDGVNYESAIADFYYYKCAADEDLINGECRGDQDDDDPNTELLAALHKKDTMLLRVDVVAICKSGSTRGEDEFVEGFIGNLQWNGTSFAALNTYEGMGAGKAELSGTVSADGAMITNLHYKISREYSDRTEQAELVIQDIPFDLEHNQVIYYNVDGYDVSSKITTIEWSIEYHDDFYKYRNDEYLYLDPSGQDRISIEFQVKADRY